MIENLPIYIPLTFVLTTVATLLIFYWTMRNSAHEKTRRNSLWIFIGLIIWLAMQAFLSFNNIYNTAPNAFPLKIVLMGILPAILIIIVLFVTSNGRRFADSLPLKNLTYLNTIRIAVEIVLFRLFVNKAVPEIMTFEGRNFDILAGISAPIIAYIGFVKDKINKKVILIWNFISLGLLLNIVVIGFLSAPTPMQQFAFDQPNIAILNFPFSWLPTFIVPLVLFGHLSSIRQLLGRGGE